MSLTNQYKLIQNIFVELLSKKWKIIIKEFMTKNNEKKFRI